MAANGGNQRSTGAVLNYARSAPLSVRLTVGRFAVLTGGGLVYSVTHVGQQSTITAPFIILLLLAMFTARPHGTLRAVEGVGPLPEVILAALVIGMTLPESWPLLAYLLIPCIGAGINFGRRTFLVVLAAGLIMIFFGSEVLTSHIGLHGATQQPSMLAGLQWVALPAIFAIAGLLFFALRQVGTVQDSYDEARVLLLQLVDLVRNLPAGLNEARAAGDLVAQVSIVAGAGQVQLLAGSHFDAMGTLAGSPAFQPDIDASLIKIALERDDAVTVSGEHGELAILPALNSEHHKVLVVLQREHGSYWNRAQLHAAMKVARHGAIQIDAARLFAQVRSIAIMEERRRLSREIHDGIAQDLAAVGYTIDELLRHCPDTGTAEGLAELRTAITRLVSELRLSIFELRKDGPERRRFSSLLSGFVRDVAAEAGLITHIVVDEALDPATPEVRTQLLSITQEAVTNVRKHAGATSLWVTFAASGDGAILRIADDGIGMARPRQGSFGLAIMRERATSIGASFAITERDGGGTVVEVSTSRIRSLQAQRATQLPA
jgi:signal transduction histidine kinase